MLISHFYGKAGVVALGNTGTSSTKKYYLFHMRIHYSVKVAIKGIFPWLFFSERNILMWQLAQRTFELLRCSFCKSQAKVRHEPPPFASIVCSANHIY
jgi:hypothetical protein